MKLYEYTQAYLSLLEKADELEPETLLDTLAAIQEPIEEKAENAAKMIRTWEAEVKAIKEEEERLANKRKALENRALSLKGYLQQQLEVIGLEKIKRPLFTIAIQNNPPGVNVLDEKAIPEEYWILPEPKLDKQSILKRLKEGESVPGCEMKQTKGLRIR